MKKPSRIVPRSRRAKDGGSGLVGGDNPPNVPLIVELRVPKSAGASCTCGSGFKEAIISVVA
jgi:hypothetical protein